MHVVECDEIPQYLLAGKKGGNETINTQDKVCYEGVFLPYIHYIVYDSKTHLVYHFINGIRD
jgi:hypothetical protein